MVTVEFFGIPRRRAGRAELAVPAATLADALAAVERACPGLGPLRQADGRLVAHFLVSLNGGEFVTDLGRALGPGDRVVLLSADAGG